jgi:hypothetical protein
MQCPVKRGRHNIQAPAVGSYHTEMVQGPYAHLGFKCWDMGIVAWVMTNVVLDDDD